MDKLLQLRDANGVPATAHHKRLKTIWDNLGQSKITTAYEPLAGVTIEVFILAVIWDSIGTVTGNKQGKIE